jgi:hypothetical protein
LELQVQGRLGHAVEVTKITQLVRSPNPKTEHDIALRLESGAAGKTLFSIVCRKIEFIVQCSGCLSYLVSIPISGFKAQVRIGQQCSDILNSFRSWKIFLVI